MDLSQVDCLKGDGVLLGPGCEHGTDVFLIFQSQWT
jgi:hypothetical protein